MVRLHNTQCCKAHLLQHGTAYLLSSASRGSLRGFRLACCGSARADEGLRAAVDCATSAAGAGSAACAAALRPDTHCLQCS